MCFESFEHFHGQKQNPLTIVLKGGPKKYTTQLKRKNNER
jgi:hypothetical protein